MFLGWILNFGPCVSKMQYETWLHWLLLLECFFILICKKGFHGDFFTHESFFWGEGELMSHHLLRLRAT